MKCFLRQGAVILPVLLAAGFLFLPPPSRAVETGGRSPGDLASPVRIAEMGDLLIVSDYREKAVFLLNKLKLKSVRSFPVKGAPLAVAYTGGRILVGNETEKRIEMYNPAGNNLGVFGGSRGNRILARDMAMDERSDTLFVVDGLDRTVKLFDREGTLIQTIMSRDIVNPAGIAIDAERSELYVSDYGDPALKNPALVHVFDYSGNLRRALSGQRAGFSRPQGMSFSEDHLFLADGVLGKVLVLDSSTGSLAKTLGSFGAEPGQLMLPLDVVIDRLTKDVYVTNNRPGRIERFPGGGLLP